MKESSSDPHLRPVSPGRSAPLEHLPGFVFVVQGGVVTYASPSVARLGHDPAALLGARFDSYRHPEDPAQLGPGELALRFANGANGETGSGNWRWLEGSAVGLDGDELLLQLHVSKVSPTLKELEESAHRFYEVFRTSPASIGIARLEDGVFTEVNDGFLRLFCYSREEILGRSAADLNLDIDPSDRSRVYERLRAGEWVEREEARVRTKEGDMRDVIASYVVIDIHDCPFVVSKLVDITPIRQLERENLKASDRERRRVAHDLHDGVTQLLVGVTFKLRAVQRGLERGDAHAADDLEEAVTLSKRALREVRELSGQVLPKELSQDGLVPALSALADFIEKVYKIPCTLQAPADFVVADDLTSTYLYRIAQEAVTNAAKHAAASRIEVVLSQDDQALTLQVDDDGVGIAEEVAARGFSAPEGLGLRSLRYRARVLGATLAVERRPQGGTTVRLHLPDAVRERVEQTEVARVSPLTV